MGLRGRVAHKEVTLKSPRVSVVIPLYKGGKFAGEAIASVLAQTYTDYEIIVVDNNASEESRRHAYPFAEKFPEKVRVVQESVQGVCSARNRGILEAKGELVALLDDDDLMYPDRLLRQVELYDLHPDASIISCWNDTIAPDGNLLFREDIPNEIFWVKILLGDTEQYRKSPFVFHLPSTMLFSKNIAIKIGMFDIRFNPYGLEDMDFEFRMYQFGKILIVPSSGIRYRYTGEGFEVQKWNKSGVRALVWWEKTDVLFSVIQEHIFGTTQSITNRKLRRIQSQWLREFGCFLMRYPQKRTQAKHLMKRAVLSGPLDYKAWKSFLRSYFPRFLYSRVYHFDRDESFPDQFSFPERFEETYFSIIQNGLAAKDIM
jgi:glycosyltransferase involved in cell wall biosynthesis